MSVPPQARTRRCRAGRGPLWVKPRVFPKELPVGDFGFKSGEARAAPLPPAQGIPRAPRGAPEPKSWRGSHPGAGASLPRSGTAAGAARAPPSPGAGSGRDKGQENEGPEQPGPTLRSLLQVEGEAKPCPWTPACSGDARSTARPSTTPRSAGRTSRCSSWKCGAFKARSSRGDTPRVGTPPRAATPAGLWQPVRQLRSASSPPRSDQTRSDQTRPDQIRSALVGLWRGRGSARTGIAGPALGDIRGPLPQFRPGPLHPVCPSLGGWRGGQPVWSFSHLPGLSAVWGSAKQ